MSADVVQLRPPRREVDRAKLAGLAELASNFAGAVSALGLSLDSAAEAVAMAEAGGCEDELDFDLNGDDDLRRQLVTIAELIARDTREVLA